MYHIGVVWIIIHQHCIGIVVIVYSDLEDADAR